MENILDNTMMGIFLDSENKSYFSLSNEFASSYMFVEFNPSKSKKFLSILYTRTKDNASILFSSFDLANAIIVPKADMPTATVENFTDLYLDGDINKFTKLKDRIKEKGKFPETLKIIGATVDKSSDYPGYKCKISRGLIGYNEVKKFLNNRDKETRYYSFEEYESGRDIMIKKGEFDFNQVNGSWFKEGFLGVQKNLNQTRLIVSATFKS